MPIELTEADLNYILSCLEYARSAYESKQYPTYQLKQEQLAKLASVENKLRRIRDES